MADTKYGKYIITEITTDLFLASGEEKTALLFQRRVQDG